MIQIRKEVDETARPSSRPGRAARACLQGWHGPAEPAEALQELLERLAQPVLFIGPCRALPSVFLTDISKRRPPAFHSDAVALCMRRFRSVAI